MTSLAAPKGIYAAQWIPTGPDGRLDKAGLAAHIRFEKSCGIKGVLALGSTGEFPRFSVEERKSLLGTVAELAGPLAAFANISDLRPHAAVELGRFAKAAGYQAAALMPPSFFPVTQPDMLAYFLHIAERVDLPIILYNFPELTGNRIGLETIRDFAMRAPMLAIKQSGGEFAYHRELVALGREMNYAVMSGADTRLPEAYRIGVSGCIGGLVNVVPDLMVEIDRRCREGGAAAAPPADERMQVIGTIIDQLTFPLNVAAALEARGLRPGAPKVPVSEASLALYTKIVRELSAAFASWGLPSPEAAPPKTSP